MRFLPPPSANSSVSTSASWVGPSPVGGAGLTGGPAAGSNCFSRRSRRAPARRRCEREACRPDPRAPAPGSLGQRRARCASGGSRIQRRVGLRLPAGILGVRPHEIDGVGGEDGGIERDPRAPGPDTSDDDTVPLPGGGSDQRAGVDRPHASPPWENTSVSRATRDPSAPAGRRPTISTGPGRVTRPPPRGRRCRSELRGDAPKVEQGLAYHYPVRLRARRRGSARRAGRGEQKQRRAKPHADAMTEIREAVAGWG